MPRLTLIASLLAFSAFNYAQYQGWSMFDEEAQGQAVRSNGSNNSGGFARVGHSPGSFHK